jgi:hypothetical protein
MLQGLPINASADQYLFVKTTQVLETRSTLHIYRRVSHEVSPPEKNRTAGLHSNFVMSCESQ